MELTYPVGLISNSNAKRNRKTTVDLNYIVSLLGGSSKCILRETVDLDELKTTVAEFRERKIDVIISNGGDGTHQKLISTLIYNFRDYSPFLVPLKSGTMNMLVKNIGLNSSPYTTVRWLNNILENKKTPNISVRSLLEINSPALSEKKYGFVFIAGCAFKLLNLYYAYPEGGNRSAAKAIFSSMGGWLKHDKTAHDIYTYTPSKFIIDEKHLQFPYLITLVSSLEKLVLGFSPFALRQVNHDGFFFMIDGEPMRQNYNPFKFFKIHDNEEWKTRRLVSRAKDLKLDVEGGFSIDGELINLEKLATVTISQGPKINFLTHRVKG